MRARLRSKLGRRGTIVGAVVAMVIAITMVPSFAAPQKIFSLTMPTTIAAGSTTDITAVIKNETPSGNSSINSFQVFVTGGLTINSANTPGGTVLTTPGSVLVSSLPPIKNGKSYSFTINVTTAAASSCDGGTATWDAQAWTGSSFTGSTFALQSAPLSQLSSSIPVSCSLSFVSGHAPTSGLVNSTIVGTDGAVQVEVIANGSRATWYSGTATISTTGNSGTSDTHLSNKSALISSGLGEFSALQGDAAGEYTVTASSGSLTTDPVTFTLYGDGINCQGTSGPVTGGGTTTTLDRTDNGPNDNGTGCVEVPYTLTPDTSTVTLLKDQAVVDQQHAEFKLAITWGVAANNYPNFGTTTFDPDGIFDATSGGTSTDDYVPSNCDVVGGVAKPPAASATQHWCFAGTTITPVGSDFQVTETFLGSGDPVVRRSN